MPPVTFTFGALGWAPTIAFSGHVRSRPAPGWLRMRITTRNVIGGLFEEDATIWDSRDRVVAQSRQLAGVRMPSAPVRVVSAAPPWHRLRRPGRSPPPSPRSPALPGIAEKIDAAREACTRLRWHNALRRRIPEAAAESRVRGAWASGELDGARLSVDIVRDLMRGARDVARGP